MSEHGSNSLRGGIRTYDYKTLEGNWFEGRYINYNNISIDMNQM